MSTGEPPIVVVALGGNALLPRGARPHAAAQREAAAEAARALAPLADGARLVVTHGNGPQVGLLALREQAAADAGGERRPLDVLDAESEGWLGYVIELELANALGARPTAALLTRVEVDGDDPAFASPSKPIGPLYADEAAARAAAATHGWSVAPDGAGWRRVVASPEPRRVVHAPAVARLVAGGFVVVCAGGGGVPVVARPGGGHDGVEAVVDKDLTAALLAQGLGARVLVLATDVDAVYEDWDGPRRRALGHVRAGMLDPSRFARGSMGPKVLAARRFALATGGRAAIGALAGLGALAAGEAGTQVTP